jgi:hypothetical protein
MARGRSNKSSNDYKKTCFQEYKGKDGNYYYNGYRMVGDFIQSIFMWPYAKSAVENKDSNGNIYHHMMATIEDPFRTTVHYARFYPQSGKAYINDIGLMASLNGSGKSKKGKHLKGFFGKIPKNK